MPERMRSKRGVEKVTHDAGCYGTSGSYDTYVRARVGKMAGLRGNQAGFVDPIATRSSTTFSGIGERHRCASRAGQSMGVQLKGAFLLVARLAQANLRNAHRSAEPVGRVMLLEAAHTSDPSL